MLAPPNYAQKMSYTLPLHVANSKHSEGQTVWPQRCTTYGKSLNIVDPSHLCIENCYAHCPFFGMVSNSGLRNLHTPQRGDGLSTAKGFSPASDGIMSSASELCRPCSSRPGSCGVSSPPYSASVDFPLPAGWAFGPPGKES